MQVGRSVQFQTLDNVLDAYELRKVPSFSIYQGKQLLFKYEGNDLDEGADLLNKFLGYLQQSAAIYTLCVYEEFNGKINDKTPYHGSWNFRFQENTKEYNQGANTLSGISKQLQAVNERLDTLAANQIQDELEQEQDPILNNMDKVGAFLGHPIVEKFLPVLLSYLKIPELKDPAKLENHAIAGVNVLPQNVLEAVQNMYDANPQKVAQSLQKLGAIAKNNPDKFNTLLTYIDMI
jgi:hypothetical protein